MRAYLFFLVVVFGGLPCPLLAGDASNPPEDISHVCVAISRPVRPPLPGYEQEPMEGESPRARRWEWFDQLIVMLQEVVRMRHTTRAQYHLEQSSRPLRRTRTDLFTPPLRLIR